MAKSNYQNLLDNLYEGIYYVDLKKTIKYWSSGAERITGYSSDEVLGKSCSEDILKPQSLDGREMCEINCILTDTLKTGSFTQTEIYITHKEGHKILIALRVAPMYDHTGKIVGATQIFTNSKEHINMSEIEAERQETAYFDPVTELPNKNSFDMVLNSTFSGFRRNNWSFGVFLFNVDNFNKFQNTYSLEIRNDILKKACNTVADNLRPFDTLGKWSELEFAAIVINVDDDKLTLIGERIRKLVEKIALPVGKGSIKITLSIGASLALLDDTSEVLMNRVKSHLEHSTNKGGNCLTTKINT
jgi:diguanylate cyclase (GGDEF)-like protein/PAS domain S-box-containing protein